MHTPPDIIDLDKDKMTDIMDKFQSSGAWNLPVIKNQHMLDSFPNLNC